MPGTLACSLSGLSGGPRVPDLEVGRKEKQKSDRAWPMERTLRKVSESDGAALKVAGDCVMEVLSLLCGRK